MSFPAIMADASIVGFDPPTVTERASGAIITYDGGLTIHGDSESFRDLMDAAVRAYNICEAQRVKREAEANLERVTA